MGRQVDTARRRYAAEPLSGDSRDIGTFRIVPGAATGQRYEARGTARTFACPSAGVVTRPRHRPVPW